MKRLIVLVACVWLSPAIAAAQGIEVGLGVGMPVGGNVVTGAQVDSLGVLRANSWLDSSPQVVAEIHKPFKLGEKFAAGPMLAFAPKLDFGLAGNTETVSPVAVGVGIAFQIPSRLKQHINVGVAYMRTAPIRQLAAGYQDGFQVPRGSSGQPLGVQFEDKSLGRVQITFTVSGWFK